MWIKSIYFKNFRNFSEERLLFCEGLNEITGLTAQGKTSVLEAIYLLISGYSFRAQHLKEVIQWNKNYFFIELLFEKYQVEQSLSFLFDGEKRRIYYNQTPIASTSILLGLLQGVVMAPDDQLIVKGSPQIRRSFLDFHIAQLDPLYVHHSSRYLRAMKQRNVLLKTRSLLSIEAWEEQMAKSAAYITAARQDAICSLHHHIIDFWNEIELDLSGESEQKNSFSIDYETQAPFLSDAKSIETFYRSLYAQKRDKELQYGVTLSGPQKDDFGFSLKGRSLKQYGSEGQKKIALIALKCAEWKRLKNISQEVPLMLVDEISASMDYNWILKLEKILKKMGQLFITSHESLFLREYQLATKHMVISNGQLSIP